MMNVGRIWRAGLAMSLAAVAVTMPAPARAPQLTALAHVDSGQWQLKDATANGAMRSVCITDPAILLQLAHPGVQCSRFVITDTAEGATVHYTCPGAGHGRTTISIETPRLIHVQTQGVAATGPFDMDYEARRVGTCSGKEASR
jgi:hypothetical protein